MKSENVKQRNVGKSVTQPLSNPHKVVPVSLPEDVAHNYSKYFSLFCILGLINNTGYVMVGTAAHDLAIYFGHKHLMPLFTFAQIVFSGLVKFIYSKYFINLKYAQRFAVNSVLMFVAFLGIALITLYPFQGSFYVCLL